MSTKAKVAAATKKWQEAEEWLDSARATYNYEVHALEAQQERDAAGLPRPPYGRDSHDRQGYVDHAEANYLAAIKAHGEALEEAAATERAWRENPRARR